MPVSRPGFTRPLPRPAKHRVPWRAARTAGTAGSTLAAQLGPWAFTAVIYVAWDPPSTAYPQWIDVTEFVDVQAAVITITRGRTDGLSDVTPGTVNLTVDNSDGRWSPANPSGPWYGQIRKGTWLRVDLIPPSGVVSTRFVGFIQQVPVGWSGRYSTTRISASDRTALLSQAPKLQTAIAAEYLADPAGVYIAGYWPLHEPAGALYVTDVSGGSAAGQQILTVRNQGVVGAGLAFAKTQGPGYDQANTVTFTPSGTPLTLVGTSGALPQGTYLQGTVGPMGNVASVTCWINTVIDYQPVWSWTDPASNYGIALMVWTNGAVALVQYPLNGVTTSIGNVATLVFGQYPVTDGSWHQIFVKLQTPAALTGTPSAGSGAFIDVAVDGVNVLGYFCGTTVATQTVWQPTLTRFTLGGAESWQLFNVNPLPNKVSMFTGSISDLVIHLYPNTTINADWYGPYEAATSMWQGPNSAYSAPESCGRRIIRLGSYAGVPAPEVQFNPPGWATVQDVGLGVTPFFNIGSETAHPAGVQQVAGQDPLTCMQTAAHTENMPLFVDRLGRITLQPSTLRQNQAAAFTINAADLDPATDWADDWQYAANQAVITASGQNGLTINTNGIASQVQNGLYSKSIDTITTTAAESTSLGAGINYAGANPGPRLAPLACEVATLATQLGIITPNPLFQGTILPWSATGGTAALSTAVLYPGAASSGLLTPDGVSTQGYLESGFSAPVTPLASYVCAGYLYAATGHTVALAVNWHTASGGYISTSSGTVTSIGTATWAYLTMTATAPAGAAYGTAIAIQGSTPPASALLYAYDLALIDPASAYGPAWYDAVLAAEISTVVAVVNWPTGTPGGSSGSYVIEGYTEMIGLGQHAFTWNTSTPQGATYQCDSPTLGLCDTPGLVLAY